MNFRYIQLVMKTSEHWPVCPVRSPKEQHRLEVDMFKNLLKVAY